jgi:hypothetical protein
MVLNIAAFVAGVAVGVACLHYGPVLLAKAKAWIASKVK